jgi:hypothetical protein
MANAARLTLGLGSGSTADKRMRLGYVPKPLVLASRITLGLGDGSTSSMRMRFGFNALPNFPINIPSGKQAILVAGLPWTGRSILEGAVPVVLNGDVILCDLVTTPNEYPITMNADGTFKIATNTDTSRQSFVADVYRVSSQAFYGEFTTWVNNRIPAQTAGIIVGTMVIGTPIAPIDLSAYVVDSEGDTLTYSIAPGSDPLPDGLALGGSVISGTPLTPVARSVTVRVTDITGDYLDLPPMSMGPTAATVGQVRYYGIDVVRGDFRVQEQASVPDLAVVISLDMANIGTSNSERNRVLLALKALYSYVLLDTWPPV